jgi:ribosomal protein S25
MDNKKLGYLVILIGVLFIVILAIFKIQINEMTNSLMVLSGGACFLESGKCIHEQNLLPFIIGAAAIVFTIGLGIYLIAFSKTTKSFETTQKDILKKIGTAKKVELKEDKFKILLTGLDEDEKKVLKAVKEQDGISQSTLKYRTDLSKTKLSIVLSQLEKKELITKVKKGKINNIFLKKAL